jgi:predicted permease
LIAFLLLTGCLLGAATVARCFNPPPALSQGLNWWVIYIALPAAVLELVPMVHFTRDLWFLVVSQWLAFAAAFFLFRFLGRRLHWSRQRIGALTLVCGLNNTSFLGYPLLEALRGREGLALGVVADQLGGFIALAIGGVITAMLYAGAPARPLAVARRVMLFPAFLAVLLAVVIGMAGGWPAPFVSILHRVSQTITPLALFSVGLKLRLQLPRGQRTAVTAGLMWKLALAPLLTLAVGATLGVTGLVLTIATLQTAMAPMFSAVILANEHQLDPDLANTTLGLGMALSFATLPLWNALL